MLGRTLTPILFLLTFLGCEKPQPQWVLWISKDGTWLAHTEHRTLAACQSAAGDLVIFGRPGTRYGPTCLPMGVKP